MWSIFTVELFAHEISQWNSIVFNVLHRFSFRYSTQQLKSTWYARTCNVFPSFLLFHLRKFNCLSCVLLCILSRGHFECCLLYLYDKNIVLHLLICTQKLKFSHVSHQYNRYCYVQEKKPSQNVVCAVFCAFNSESIKLWRRCHLTESNAICISFQRAHRRHCCCYCRFCRSDCRTLSPFHQCIYCADAFCSLIFTVNLQTHKEV